MRIIKHLLVLLLVKLPIQFMGIPIVATVLLLRPKVNRLPSLFKWWDVGDELDRVYGLKGDLGYQADMIKKGYDPDGFWSKFNWLALRNPANYFQHHVLGKKFLDAAHFDFHEESEIKGKPVGDWSAPGLRTADVIMKDGSKIWEYYIVKRYKWFPSKCFRARIGWKIWEDEKPKPTMQWVFSVIPFKSYKGE